MRDKKERREYATYCLVCNGIRLHEAYKHKGADWLECLVCGHTKRADNEPSE